MIATAVAWYKFLSFGKRVTVVALLIVITSSVSYYEGITSYLEEIDRSSIRLEKAQKNYATAKKQEADLPKLEAVLNQTEAELKQTSKKLPDEFVMDKVLQKTAMIAQDIGLDLVEFVPGKGHATNTAFRYMEMPIRLDLRGTYGEIATFFDRIAHLELMIHLRDVQLSLSPSTSNSGPSHEGAPSLADTSADGEMQIAGTANMIIYRALSVHEAQTIDQQSNPHGSTRSTPLPSSDQGEAN